MLVIYYTMIVLAYFCFGEYDKEVKELLNIIFKRLDINSIHCTFSEIQFLKNGKTDINNGELAYQKGNVYYSQTYYPYRDFSPEKEINEKSDRQKNLLELLSKKWYGKEKTEEEEDLSKKADICYVSLYNGRYLNCTSGFNYKREPDCVECYPYIESNKRCLYVWIRRFNLLNSLGISWIPSLCCRHSCSDEVFYSESFIPVKTKPLYDSIINSLRGDLEKPYPHDFYKIYKKDGYRILLRDYNTAFWFDNNNDIVKIQQCPFYANAIYLAEEELKEKYNIDVPDLLEYSRFNYIYSDFKDYPDGIRIPLKIEFTLKLLSNIYDTERESLRNKLNEMRSKNNHNSKEFKDIQKELSLRNVFLREKDIEEYDGHFVTYIHPDNLILNEPLPDEIFQLKIEEGTPIYQGESFENVTSPDYKPYFYHDETEDNSENTFISYLKKNINSLLFTSICIGFVLFSIAFTKKYLGWKV